ncbi:cation/H(+) antiporter 15 [Vigna angularis]|uniref:cation/H(+) antiporter 15 n=1 Tax=Phaseolus angularis TaxID=3914 RepID=UPI00080A5E2B|nr:cation/H(+) antiporter 15 [Vigna angularis]
MKHNSITSVYNDTSTGNLVVCLNNDRTIGSLGMWIGDNPLDFVIPITLCQVIILVLLSKLLHYILRTIHTPKFICSIIAGVLLGPTCIGHDEAFLGTMFPLKQALVMNTLAKIGTIYCVFLTSLKMDVLTTLKAAKRCWRFGVFPFFASFFVTATMLSFYSPHGADRDKNKMSIYNFPNVFTLSSFAVISDILMELNLLATELGRIALSSAMISEILQWCTMELQFNTNLSSGFIVVLLAGACGFGLLCVVIVRPLVNIIVEKTLPGEPMKEVYVVVLLLGPLVMAAISDSLGVFFVAGPLLYGFILPNGPPVATTIIERVELIVSEFFMPFFYMYVGKRTDLSGLHDHWKVALTVQGILFLGCVVKIIDTEVYSVAVMYVVLITALCVPSIKFLYRHCRVCITPTVQEGRVRTIQNCKPNTGFNIVSCVHTDQHVHSMIALTEACNPTLESPICLYVIHLIELSGKSTPILLPMNKNNRKSLSVNYPNTNRILRAYENYSENSSGPVTVLSYVNVAPYKSMHEAVCNLAEDNSVHLLIIPFHQNDQSVGIHVCSVFRELNENFAANSRGTLGILVDRFSLLSMSNYKMPFHVGIFFVGGEDDREALALGIRMLERATTRVTLIRFVLLRKGDSGFLIYGDVQNEEDTLERTLNESLIDEFLAKKDYSFDLVNVVYHEVVVEGCIQVLEAIRVMENDYDLVMVGKQHSMGDFREEEMSNLMDNSDQLGILGDMLSSSEFCEGKTPVLVMKSGVKRVKQFTNSGRHIFRSAS